MNEENKDTSSSLFECDYDSRSTVIPLYKALELKDWDLAILIADKDSQQAATWISRKEPSGKLRWRLLPLHAAVIFQSPEKVIKTLLVSYPPGAQSKDDQGMLPIHLAFRNGASEGIVNLLLVAYPQSVKVKDRKGRIPLVLAQASSSANKNAFLRALERGPSYYAVAAAATEKAMIVSEQKAIFDAKLREAEQENKGQISSVLERKEDEIKSYEEKMKTLEQDAESSRNMTAVLSDHISALEAQLESRGDAELLLANKCKKLEDQVKQLTKERDTLDVEYKVEQRLNQELEDKLLALEDELGKNTKLLEAKSSSSNTIEHEYAKEKKSMKETQKGLEKALVQGRTTISALQEKLNKREVVEESLSNQLCQVARKAAEMAASKSVIEENLGTVEEKHTARIKELEIKIKLLEDKLRQTADTISSMIADQEQICTLSKNHEEMISTASVHEDSMKEAILEQEKNIADIHKQRHAMLDIFENQLNGINAIELKRKFLIDNIADQKRNFSQVEYLRNMIIDCAGYQKQKLFDSVKDIQKVLKDGTKSESDESLRDYVDEYNGILYTEANGEREGVDESQEENNQERVSVAPNHEALVSSVKPKNKYEDDLIMKERDYAAAAVAAVAAVVAE